MFVESTTVLQEVHMIQKETSPIETDRLIIRSLTMNDLPAIASILSNPETMRYVGGVKNRHDAEIQLQYWIEDYARDGFGFMAFVNKHSKLLIGYGGFLHQEVDGQKDVELGFVIDQAYWKQGYAKEAAIALKEYGQKILGFSEIISIIHKDNQASVNVAIKIGMRLLKETIVDGVPCLIYHCLN